MADKLGMGAPFPSLSLTLTDETQFRVPEDLTTKFAAVLFYRGHW